MPFRGLDCTPFRGRLLCQEATGTGYKSWSRRKSIDGLVLLLSRSANPQTVLESQRATIDDEVVDALIERAWVAVDANAADQALPWMELAVQASRLGGTAVSLGRCYEQRAFQLSKLQSAERDSAQSNRWLAAAIEAAVEAARLYEKARCHDALPIVYGLLGTLHEEKKQPLAALRFRLLSIRGWLTLPDVNEAMPRLIKNLCVLYREVGSSEIDAANALIAENETFLRGVVAGKLQLAARADLFRLLGSVGSARDDFDGSAHDYEEALRLYRHVGDQRGEFFILHDMQNQARQREDLEGFVALGEACLHAAPPDLDPEDLGPPLHLLADGWRIAGRHIEALRAFLRLADLYGEDGKPCLSFLLQAALMAEDAKQFADAEAILDRGANCPGGARSFWLRDVSLADLLRRRSDLGGAILHADRATHTSILINDLTLRVASLWLSAQLYMMAGRLEHARRRAEDICDVIFHEHVSASGILLDKLYEHPVALPAPSAVLALAATVCSKLGDPIAAQSYWDRLRALPADKFTDTVGLALGEGDEAEDRLLLGGNKLLRGQQLLLGGNPHAAVEHFEEAIRVFESTDPQIAVSAYEGLGFARQAVGDPAAAYECFRRGLVLIANDPNEDEEIACRFHLVTSGIDSNRIDPSEALEHLSRLAARGRSPVFSLGTIMNRRRGMVGSIDVTGRPLVTGDAVHRKIVTRPTPHKARSRRFEPSKAEMRSPAGSSACRSHTGCGPAAPG